MYYLKTKVPKDMLCWTACFFSPVHDQSSQLEDIEAQIRAALMGDSGDPEIPEIVEVTELHTYYHMEE